MISIDKFRKYMFHIDVFNFDLYVNIKYLIDDVFQFKKCDVYRDVKLFVKKIEKIDFDIIFEKFIDICLINEIKT